MSNVATTSRELSSYLEAFTEFVRRAPGQSEGWLRKLREDSFARFCEVGFPTTHDEDWRFTNVSAIAQTAFQLPKAAGQPALSGAEGPAGQPAGRRRYEADAEQIAPYRLAGTACQLVFVNGKFAAKLSSLTSLPKGVSAGSLAGEIRRDPKPLERYLGQYLNTQRDVFCALNTAFLEDGAYVHIGRGTVLEAPIYLLFVTAASDTPVMTHPRNLVIAEEDSQATIVEDYVSLGGGVAFSNAATELIAGEHTVLSHYLIEREHTDAYNISTLRLQQGRSANVASHSVLLGGGLVRNNVHPVLAGEGADCLINGLFIGNGRQHMDNYMLVEHASPHCGSRQFYNGILDGHSRGVFHGRIIVHKDAQKTDAKQTNRNLLLSDDAQIDTKPQLEIYADDVKCTHGATIGQIEEDELFYLRSRGIDEPSARRLLLFAFASECLDRMKPGPVRSRIEELVNEWLFHIKPGSPETGKGAHNRAMHWEEVG